MGQEIIIKNDIGINLTMIMSKVTLQGNEVFSVEKSISNRLKNFFQSKKIYLKMLKDKIVIENIILDGKIKIKDASNRISNNINNRFTISKSYVATTKNVIIDKCKKFYSNIKEVVAENKLILDISRETNLQRELYKKHRQYSSGVRVFNKKLNLNPNFCQKVDEASSVVMVINKPVKQTIKNNLLTLSSNFGSSLENKGNSNEEIRKMDAVKTKKLVKSSSLGYMSIVAVTVLSLVSVLILSYTIVNIMMK